MKLQCPNCLNRMDAGRELAAGQRVECPYCNKTFAVTPGSTVDDNAVARLSRQSIRTQPTADGVKIVAIDIPFFSLVVLMLEIALASIPALFVLYAIFMVVGRVLGGAFASL